MKKQPMRILIVEDEPAHAEAIRRAFGLSNLEATVEVVGTLQEYRNFVASQLPDLVLLDWKLPNGSGMDVLTTPPEDGPFPILIMTSFGNEEIAVKAMKAGALDYIVKSPEAFAAMPRTAERARREWRLLQKHKEMNEELKASEDRYRDLVEKSQDLICTHDLKGNLLSVNEAAVKWSGFSRNKLLTMNLRNFIIPEVRDQFDAYLDELRSQGRAKGIMRVRTAGGEIRDWEYDNTLRTDRLEGPIVRGMAHDITERRKLEWEVRQTAKDWQATFDAINSGIALLDTEGRFMRCNQAMEKLLGKSSEEILGRRCWELVHGTSGPIEECPVQRMWKSGHREAQVLSLGERWIEVTADPILDTKGRTTGAIHIIADITDQKQAEEKLMESEEQYRTAIESSNDGVAIVEGETLRYVNKKFCVIFGYQTPEEVLGKNFTISLHPKDRERVVAYNRRRQLGESVPTQYEFKGIRKDGELIDVETSSARMPFRGEFLTLAYLRDISDRKKNQVKLEHTLENLRKALGGIIQVVSQTVEVRDPYTAGHQQRVADLARAIGQEMGLDADRVDGLRMAGVIHDLGKVSIPAEILSKPTQLKEIEFQLIRTHPQVGYDILRDIEFPWPIADIIFQHHERLDGSGYPQGLKVEAILPEAKILMVADVVEAMASYRPYRPALGLEAALEEIEKKAGVSFDRDAVDTCLRLFREKGYQLQ